MQLETHTTILKKVDRNQELAAAFSLEGRSDLLRADVSQLYQRDLTTLDTGCAPAIVAPVRLFDIQPYR